MAVIMDYYYNGTRIIVKDDFCCSEEEAEEIIKKIGEIATLALSSAQQEDKTAQAVTGGQVKRKEDRL